MNCALGKTSAIDTDCSHEHFTENSLSATLRCKEAKKQRIVIKADVLIETHLENNVGIPQRSSLESITV
jgi:hypothetical protein